MKFIKENWSAILFTLLVHVVVLTLFAVNIDFERHVVIPTKPVAVQAKVINGAAIDAEIKRQEKLEQEKLDTEIKRQQELEDKALQAKKAREVEEKRLADLEQERLKQTEIDKQRKIDVQKKTDLEKKRLSELETKRKAEEASLAKLKAEQVAEKKKVEQQKKAQEVAAAKKQAELEAKQKAEAEAKKKAAELAAKKKAEQEARKKAAAALEAKRLAELQAALASEMAAEESLNEVLESGALTRYRQLLSQHIERNWRAPASVEPGLKCTLNVKQIPGGDVTAVSFGTCNANEAVKESILQAVHRASPLPSPEDARIFDRELIIEFEPDI